MTKLLIACADIGSIAARRFGWALQHPDGSKESGDEIRVLVDRVVDGMRSGAGVALGFECPLFVPLPNDPTALTSARKGEGSRAWSAGAGSGALATGLTEVAWILREIRVAVAPESEAVLTWPDAGIGKNQLFLWEAFVTGAAKGRTHTDDAEIAVEAFVRSLPRPDLANCITVDTAYSLVAAAMLRTGWSRDVELLARPAIVIRGTPPQTREILAPSHERA